MTTTEIKSWGAHSVAWVQSDDVQGALDALNSGQADGLGLSPYHGYALHDISFLAAVANLQGVVLPFAKNYDIKVLESMPGLRFLTVAENRQALNYPMITNLEELRIEWHSKLVLPASSSKLRSLYIDHYKTETKTMRDLPAYENLRELELVQGDLVSLNGIEHLHKLVDASFSYMRKLHSVAALAQTSVERLQIGDSKKIVDLESLSGCQKLTRLRLNNCGSLKSLKFLNDFKMLEEFRFVNTFIEDGDMTPLLRMKSVGFFNRRNYSHTPEEIDEAISKN